MIRSDSFFSSREEAVNILVAHKKCMEHKTGIERTMVHNFVLCYCDYVRKQFGYEEGTEIILESQLIEEPM